MRWIVRTATGDREVRVEETPTGWEVELDGQRREIDLRPLDGALASMRYAEDHRSFEVAYQRQGPNGWRVGVGEREFELQVLTPMEAVQLGEAAAAGGPSRLEAPIPGKVVAVQAAEGDEVAAGEVLVVLEAMKMENELTAAGPGRVLAVHVAPGDTVVAGALLVELE